MTFHRYVIFLILLNLGLSHEIWASPHHYCHKYIEEAAKQTGVLPEILWAVAQKESKFGSGPWPWTFNVKGKSYYFSDKLSAKKFLLSLPKKLQKQTDIGCMQINWGYHSGGFKKITQLLNPRLNIIYAAYYLKELYLETGKWSKALAAYHSRKWLRGGKYAYHVAFLVKNYNLK